MDEILEAAAVVADSELEGAFVWLLRVIGIVLVLVGLGLWLFTDAGLLVLPAVCLVVGVAFVVVPGLLVTVVKLA